MEETHVQKRINQGLMRENMYSYFARDNYDEVSIVLCLLTSINTQTETMQMKYKCCHM